MEDNEDPLGLGDRRGGAKVHENGTPSLLASLVPPTTGPSEQNDHSASSTCDGVEVEMVDQDEFDFLEGAEQLGSLRSGKRYVHVNVL